MLIGASPFLSQVDLLRTVAVTGAKGSGKDLLCCELAEYYLNQGYRYATNQNCVWNDNMFYVRPVSVSEYESLKSGYQLNDKGDVVKRVVVDNSFFREVR